MASVAQLRQVVGDDVPPYSLTDEDIGRAVGTAGKAFWLAAVLLRRLLESRSGETFGQAWTTATQGYLARYNKELGAGTVTLVDGDTSVDIDSRWVTERIHRLVDDWAQTGNTEDIPASKLVNAPGASEAEIVALIKAYSDDRFVELGTFYAARTDLRERDAGTARFPYVRNAGVVDLNQLTGAGEYQAKDNARVLNYPADLPHSGSDFLTSDDDLYVIVRRMGEQSGVEIIHQQLRTDYAPQSTWDRFADATGHWGDWLKRDTRAVSDWATADSAALIPVSKLPVGQRGLNRSAVDQRVRALADGATPRVLSGSAASDLDDAVDAGYWLTDPTANGNAGPVNLPSGQPGSTQTLINVVSNGTAIHQWLYSVPSSTAGDCKVYHRCRASSSVAWTAWREVDDTAEWAQVGNDDLIPADKLPGQHGAAGLTQAQVDTRVGVGLAGAGLLVHSGDLDLDVTGGTFTRTFAETMGKVWVSEASEVNVSFSGSAPAGWHMWILAAGPDDIAVGASSGLTVRVTDSTTVIEEGVPTEGIPRGVLARVSRVDATTFQLQAVQLASDIGPDRRVATEGTLPNPKVLPPGTDFNTVLASGWYRETSDADQRTTGSNKPSDQGVSLAREPGYLFVSPSQPAPGSEDQHQAVVQRWWYADTDDGAEFEWQRARYWDTSLNSGVGGWGWSAWEKRDSSGGRSRRDVINDIDDAVYSWALKSEPSALIDASKLVQGTSAWARPNNAALIPASKLPIGFQEEDVVGLSAQRNYFYNHAPSGPRQGQGGIIFTYHDTNGRILFRAQSGESSISLIQAAPDGWSALVWVTGPTPVTIGTGPGISITSTSHTVWSGQAAALPGYISQITRVSATEFRIAALHRFSEIPDSTPAPTPTPTPPSGPNSVKVGSDIWTGGPATTISLSTIHAELVRQIETGDYDTLRFRFVATVGRGTASRSTSASQYVDFDVSDLQSGDVTLGTTAIQWIRPTVTGPSSSPSAGICWLVLSSTGGSLNWGGNGTNAAGNWSAHLLRTGAAARPAGITIDDVDRRVGAKVYDWAEAGNNDQIPLFKLPSTHGGTGPSPLEALPFFSMPATGSVLMDDITGDGRNNTFPYSTLNARIVLIDGVTQFRWRQPAPAGFRTRIWNVGQAYCRMTPDDSLDPFVEEVSLPKGIAPGQAVTVEYVDEDTLKIMPLWGGAELEAVRGITVANGNTSWTLSTANARKIVTALATGKYKTLQCRFTWSSRQTYPNSTITFDVSDIAGGFPLLAQTKGWESVHVIGSGGPQKARLELNTTPHAKVTLDSGSATTSGEMRVYLVR